MSEIAPGWYRDPADLTTQRYWDGEGWLGDPIPADATPPKGPPKVKASARPREATATAARAPAAAGRGGSTQTQTRTPPPAAAYPLPYPYAKGMPPPRPHGLPLATPGARFMARLFDVAAVVLLNVVVNGWFAYQWWLSIEPAVRTWYATGGAEALAVPDRASWLLYTIMFVGLALWFAYEVPAVASTGQTLGKRILGIKVMRLESPDPLGFGRAMRRWNRMGLPTLLWPCCGIGLLLQAVDSLFITIDRPLRQAIHDKAAFTVVVDTRRQPVHPPPRDGAKP